MRFDILTLFPEMFDSPLNHSILKRAREQGLISVTVHNIRDYATDKHRVTDDTPYGGGGGMVMKPEPIFRAVEAILAGEPSAQGPVILLSPQGRLFTQQVAGELAGHSRILLICGRYEGVDERVREFLVDDEISVGDYVLTGGEIPAMVVVDAVSRLVAGVLGDPAATLKNSHARGLLEYPQYTRPATFRGHAVPEALLSGNHGEIALWRRREGLRRTYERRPDLLQKAELSEEDLDYLESLRSESS